MVSKESIIVVTGAAGFIGSCMAGYLNERGFENLILVDEFNEDEKELNLHEKKYAVRVERENFFEWLAIEKPDVKFVFHLGARTDTTEFDYAVHQHLNVEFSQKIWNYCFTNNVPLVYASSAATYGGGEFGYSDEHGIIEKLQPLNPYGISKNEFDKYALRQAQDDSSCPPFWAGLKFFNVYGPNEFHKGRMASMIFHSFNQIKQNGFVKLFKSHKKNFNDGEQLRDFIYVKDVIKIMLWMMQEAYAVKSETSKVKEASTNFTSHLSPFTNGIYNIGTGKARSFKDLVKATFTALDMKPEIIYIDMPQDIRDTYQYFTEAEINKIRLAGYTSPLYTLEQGIDDYVSKYLSDNRFL